MPTSRLAAGPAPQLQGPGERQRRDGLLNTSEAGGCSLNVVCAWCRDVIEHGGPGAAVSFGICAGCADRLAANVATRHEAADAPPETTIISLDAHRRIGGAPRSSAEQVLILRRRHDDQRQCAGVIVARDDESALVLPSGPVEWARGEGAVLVVLTPGQQLVTAVEFARADGDAIHFRTLTPWKVLNRRRTPRAATNIRAQVHTPGARGRFEASILDLSTGGMRLFAESRVSEPELTVELRALDYALQLDCEVLESVPLDDGFELRLRFGPLAVEQRVAIDRLVALLTSAARVSEVGPEWGWEVPDDDLPVEFSA